VIGKRNATKLQNDVYLIGRLLWDFLLPVFLAFFVSPTLLMRVYIFNVAFSSAMLAIHFIFGVCLFSIGCLRYKRKDKGILPNYAGWVLDFLWEVWLVSGY